MSWRYWTTACFVVDVAALISRWHKVFLAMLPQIVGHARIAFRYLNPEARAEAVQEVVCNALKAFVRLVQLKKTDLAYPTVPAKYGVAQTRDHRKVGGHLNVCDVSSEYRQRLKGVVVERLDHFDEDESAWQEAVVEDTRTASVPDIVAFRCDFADWLRGLRRRDRRIAESLALGNRTTDVATRFNVCTGRVSQLRRELAESWRAFIGDEPAPAAAQPTIEPDVPIPAGIFVACRVAQPWQPLHPGARGWVSSSFNCLHGRQYLRQDASSCWAWSFAQGNKGLPPSLRRPHSATSLTAASWRPRPGGPASGGRG
ncbi:MAG: hypothetical protein ABSG86_23570 [Thermoguttaceae bacterium]|jgi:hypothetical protein